MKVQVINTGKTEERADLTGRGEEGESHYEFSWGHTRFETTRLMSSRPFDKWS